MNNDNCYESHTGSSLRAGTVLKGRYVIETVLGQGGFGITYSALDTQGRCRVAVKELFPSRSVTRSQDLRNIQVNSDQNEYFRYLLESFEQEAKTLIDLQNKEGIIRLMHVFPENNTAYYVMEFLDGENLIQRLRREGPMRWEQLAPILKTVLMALNQIHAVGLIHRDISPDNIFLAKNGTWLIDFGSVRKYQGKGLLTAIVKHNFSPWEQFLANGHQGPWTDIYALAVTAYYALSGVLPPTAADRWNKDSVVPLEHLCPNLPKEICAAIHQGMNVEPERRFQNVQQFCKALKLGELTPAQTPSKAALLCLRGNFAGKVWYLQPDTALRIGRNMGCDICYPAGYPGVSRTQCTIYYSRDSRCFIKDDRSRYGTRLTCPGKNVLLEPETWYIADGTHIFFGAQEEYLLTK